MPPLVVQDAPGLAGIGAVPASIPGPITGAPGASVQSNVLLFYVDQATGKIALGPGPLASASAPNASAALDMQSTTGGFLMPRLTTAQRNAIPAPATGLLIFNTTTGSFEVWNGATWTTGLSSNAWLLGGNAIAGTVIGGTTDNQDVRLLSNNVRRFTILKTGEVAVGPIDPAAGHLFEVQQGGAPQLFMIATGEVGIGGAPTAPSQILRAQRSQNGLTEIAAVNPNAGAGAEAAVALYADTEAYRLLATSSAAATPNAFMLYDATAAAARLVVNAIGATAVGPTAPAAGNLFEVQDAPRPAPFQITDNTNAQMALFRRDDNNVIEVVATNVDVGALARAEFSAVSSGHSYGVGTWSAAYVATPSCWSVYDNNAGSDRIVLTPAGLVAIGAAMPDASSILDLQGTTRGFLKPRLTTVQETAIATPATGLEVFNTTDGVPKVNLGSTTTPVWVQTAYAWIVTAVKTASYNANIGELVQCDPTATGTFPVNLPVITAGMKGAKIAVTIVTAAAVGGATPQNVTVTAGAGNTISGGPLAGSVLVSGKSTIVLVADGGTNWMVEEQPATPATPATLAGGNQTLTRLAKITRYVAPAVLGAPSTYTFSNAGAQAGDLCYVSLPTHDANTLTIKNAATTTIATYAATVAGGGIFIYNGADWEVLVAGNSTT